MVWYNSKERGVRLGCHAGVGLSISCTKCGRIARIRIETALRLWGERTFSRDIARDLRCSACGHRAASIQVIAETRPAWVVAENPSGGFDVGPNYPIVDPPLAPASKRARRQSSSTPD